jgi:hypothetical protein
MGIKPADQVARDYGLEPSELAARLRSDTAFQAQVKEYKQVWLHPSNAAERVRIKTAVLAEDGLVDLWAIFVNPEVNPATRLEVHKHVTKLADVEPRREGEAMGSRFSVTIVLPGEEPMKVVAEGSGGDEEPHGALALEVA